MSHNSYFEKRLRSSITSVLPPQTLKKDDIKVAINVISLSGVKGADEHNQKRLGLFLEHFEETCGLSLDIHVCPGVVDERRGFGISKALVQCLRDDINQQADYIYIFEDDVRLFNNDFCHYENRVKLWTNAPPDAFLILIGGHHWSAKASKYEDYDIVDSAYGGYGLTIPSRSVQTLIDKWSEDIHSTKEALDPDVTIYKFAKQQKQTIYAKVPLWVEHPNAWSNTWHKFRHGYNKTIPDINHPYKPSPKIAVGIPTHNRIGYVQLTSGALKGTFPAEDIWVFDDMSTEYTRDDLVQWYGTQNVQLSETHLKADAMARHILEWFLKSEYDVVVLLDSDLLVAPNWVASLRTGLQHSLALWSLYRSGAPKHVSKDCHEHMCTMPSMGNAGTVWRRDLATMMLSEMPNRDGGFDWGWSEWCQKNAIPMEALRQSAVLHIGMHGSWSHETSAEKSVGFPMDMLSSETRKQAERFLKGAKPKAILSSELLNKKLPTIHAVILVRIYEADKPKWTRYELDQWVEYMLYAGITKIYLYDAHMTEDESLKEWSDKWAHVLVYHDWGKYNHPYTIQGTQVRAYQHAIDTYGTLSDWQIAYDIDEYPFSTLDQSSGFLQRKVAELSTDKISELSLQNFIFVGKPCHGKERVIRRIVRRSPTKANNLDKPIYRPTRVRAQVHHNSLKVGLSKDIDPSILRTNHYWGLRRQNWGFPCESTKNCWSEVDMIQNTIEDRSALIISDYLDSHSTAKRQNDILWVIPAFKRAWSLDLVLQSLSGTTNILVSKDADSDEIDAVLEKYSVNVISHPFSCSRHPNQFPAKDESLNENYKGDTYGNPRSPWATCLKHHWWWMMKQAWARNPERVCVLEDDTVIHPQAFEWIEKQTGNVKLTPDEIAVPWCMSTKEWQAIDPKAFCEHDDYNWDQTIAWMFKKDQTNIATVSTVSLSMHVGECGGWDAGGRSKECSDSEISAIQRRVEQWQMKFLTVSSKQSKWLTAHGKPNGGWGHPKDWAHCLESRQKNIIINANQPATEHTYEHKDKISIHILTTGDRDIHHLKQKIPNAHIFKGSVGYDESCKNILVDIGAKFKKYYYGTLDYIEEGKLGHWCSNLRFAQYCNGLCVLIEDDIMLNAKDVAILQETLQHPWTTPVLALGPSGDTINVWNGSATKRVFEIVREGINQPMDLFFNFHGIYTKRGPIGTLVDPSNSKKTSIIRSMLTPIKLIDINEQIDSAKQKSEPTIKTSDLFAAIDYNAPENKGPWKQGWDYDYDNRFKDGLTVHVVPHSHNDPGWIKTYHTYYSTQTRHILDTVIAALTEDPRRTFIWAEISYFSLWWDDATSEQKEQAKKLVAEKRLDFVTGGWVMNDEASVTARATRWHLQEGREWLQNTFGITPQYSWAIDPFGHSAGQAQVLKELGYKGMLIQRVHYAVKKQLAEKQQLEFQWQTPAGDIFTHMMPFYSYDGPHTCGPDPSVCCQFDFARIGKGTSWTGCPWGKVSVPITDANVAERSKLWLDQVYKKAMLYRGKDVLIPVGDDFRYQSMDEAHKQYKNYQRMFDWISDNVPTVKVSFSTLTKYFDAVRNQDVPKLQGSFFPYSDREQDYWTGYFNSRIFYKGYDRLLESLIAAVENNCPNVDIHSEKRALGLFQHHDGITGTAKSHVVQDYYNTMQTAVHALEQDLKTCLDVTSPTSFNPLHIATPTHDAHEIRPIIADECQSTPMASSSAIHFNDDGMITHINDVPIDESYVWRTNTPGSGKAGAYLMSVQARQDVLRPLGFSSCHTSHYTEWTTVFDMITRKVREYHDGTIELVFSIDIRSRNNGELWSVWQPSTRTTNRGGPNAFHDKPHKVQNMELCSDVHGLTWECHVERKDAPLQAKFWPMPTMAWLDMGDMRLTFAGAQPTGVALHEGAIILMLDRRGNQDDARGLGQGITDSRPVDMRFGVLVEEEESSVSASVNAIKLRKWMLNPEINIM